MSQHGRLYFYVCGFVWCVLSGELQLFEDNTTEELRLALNKWSGKSARLANWLADQWNWTLDQEKVSADKTKSFYGPLENMCDEFIYRSSLKLAAVTSEAHQRCPKIETNMWLYYYYCRWLLDSLNEFDTIMKDDLRQTEYYSQYQNHRFAFEELVTLLGPEKPELATSGCDERLNIDISTVSKHLVAEWQQLIYSTASTPR